jgi:hypothetical protein
MAELTAEDTDLQIETHKRFHRYWRVAQQGVVTLLFVIVVAALLGLMGHGPLARTQKPLASGAFQVSFDRFLRVQGSGKIVLEQQGRLPGRQIAVHLDQPLVDALGIQGGDPAPLLSAADTSGVTYLFGVQGGSGARITLKTKPVRPGLIRGQLRVDGEAVSITQIVWP